MEDCGNEELVGGGGGGGVGGKHLVGGTSLLSANECFTAGVIVLGNVGAVTLKNGLYCFVFFLPLLLNGLSFRHTVISFLFRYFYCIY